MALQLIPFLKVLRPKPDTAVAFEMSTGEEGFAREKVLIEEPLAEYRYKPSHDTAVAPATAVAARSISKSQQNLNSAVVYHKWPTWIRIYVPVDKGRSTGGSRTQRAYQH